MNIERLNKNLAGLKLELGAYLADTSIPVFERWHVYIESYDNLNNKLDYISEAPTSRIKSYITEVGSNYSERYRVFRFKDCLEEIAYLVEENLPISASELLLMEDLLKYNLGSFTYDW